MTDLELVELAVRRTEAKIDNSVKIDVCSVLLRLADELAKLIKEQR